MTVLWLLIWLLSGTPDVTFSPDLNSWAVALIACVAIDIFGGSKV